MPLPTQFPPLSLQNHANNCTHAYHAIRFCAHLHASCVSSLLVTPVSMPQVAVLQRSPSSVRLACLLHWESCFFVVYAVWFRKCWLAVYGLVNMRHPDMRSAICWDCLRSSSCQARSSPLLCQVPTDNLHSSIPTCHQSIGSHFLLQCF